MNTLPVIHRAPSKGTFNALKSFSKGLYSDIVHRANDLSNESGAKEKIFIGRIKLASSIHKTGNKLTNIILPK